MHQPSAGVGGTASDIAIQADLFNKWKRELAQITADQTGQTVEQIIADGDRDRWFTAQEAKDYGFVDHVLTARHRPSGLELSRSTKESSHEQLQAPGRLPGTGRARSRGTSSRRTSSAPATASRSRTRTTSCTRSAIIFLGVQVDDASANDVMAQLLHLEHEDPDRDILIYINSPGGSFTSLMAIYDTMQFVRPDIQTYCLGQAASAAAVLLSAGTPGKRYALPNSRVLIHQPATEGTYGQVSDLEIQANEIQRVRRQMEVILAHHTGKDPDQIRKPTSSGTRSSPPKRPSRTASSTRCCRTARRRLCRPAGPVCVEKTTYTGTAGLGSSSDVLPARRGCSRSRHRTGTVSGNA